MKKWLSTLLALCMLLGLGTSVLAEDTVSFWLDKMGNPEIAERLFSTWSEAAGMKIEYSNYIDTASYQTAISQSIDSDAAPDMFTWWSGEQLQSLMESGKILPLDDLWETIIGMGVSPDVKDAFTYNGNAYAVPYSLLYNVIIYNKDAFAKAGIKELPKTFDEFLAICQTLKDMGIIPIGVKNDSWASFIWFQALVAAYDPDLYLGICDGSIAYTDERMVEVMNMWSDMLAKGYFADAVGYQDNFKRFALSEVAMIIEPQTSLTSMQIDYGMEPEVNISAFGMPSKNGAKSVVFFEASPIAVPVKAKSPETSKKALAAYYSVATQTITAEDQGIILTNTVASDNASVTKVNAMSTDTEQYQSILRFYENTPSALRDVALDELSKFMYNNQDVATTLANIQRKADETFKK